MKGAWTEKIMTMKDLTEARRRYQRLLDALGHTSRIDRELRAELIEAIDNIDRKIGRLSHAASRGMPPDTGVAVRYGTITR